MATPSVPTNATVNPNAKGTVVFVQGEAWLRDSDGRLTPVKPGDAVKALAARPAVRFVAMTLAAPFIGLAFFVVAPVAGFVALLWTAGQALTERKQAA